MVELSLAWKVLPVENLFPREELKVAHFFLLCRFDLDVDLVASVTDQSVVVFELSVELLLKAGGKVEKRPQQSVCVGGRDFVVRVEEGLVAWDLVSFG